MLRFTLLNLFILIFMSIGFAATIPKQQCGYESCPSTKPNVLNVHMIPHSHDDVGWKKTVDEYYYGSRKNIQYAGIQYTIGSVVEALHANPDRRFIQVETAYFSKWWKQQDDRTKNIVINLVNNGQMEIVSGAWSMNDEAITHYQSTIDNFAWGLKMINDTFGACGRPKIGWQIDPFGHSNEMATIFTQLGFDATIFTRYDYRDRKRRLDQKELEFVWQGSSTIGNKSNIMTSIMYDSYSTPTDFCYDVICSIEPVNDDEDSPGYNLKDKVKHFVETLKSGAKYFTTNNYLFPVGGDFTYQGAHVYYTNIEKLMKGANELEPTINVFFSTPSCYIKAVNEASKNISKFKLKTDDFLPYASDAHSYWTGYYTSRPNSKYLARIGNNLLQVTKQLISFERIKSKDFSKNLTLLREALGVMQHHDAITGTEKQAVSQDYARLITKGMKTAEVNITSVIFDLLKKENQDVSKINVRLESCLLANVTHCEASNSDKFIVTVYNPLSKSVSHHIRLPVNGDWYQINGTKGEIIEYDVVENNRTFKYMTNIKPSAKDLVFLAKNIPPHGIKLFYVQKLNKTNKSPLPPVKDKNYFGNKTSGFRIDPTTNLLSQVTLNGVTLDVTQEIRYYTSAKASSGFRASGAYIFRPASNKTDAFKPDKLTATSAFRGNVVDEFYQSIREGISQVIRVYKNESYIEFDWVVGDLDLKLTNNAGMEVVSQFHTKLNTDGVFYTDSNGREMIKRKLNYRETYTYTNEEPISGNYYPIASRILLRDTKKNIDFSIINDRGQGGTSLDGSTVELMIHRRLTQDDNFGVEEVLNEQEFGKGVIVRGQHFLTFGNNSTPIQRHLMQKKHLTPWVFVGNSDSLSFEDAVKKFSFEFAGLKQNLSENLNILTLEPWNSDSYLLRVEHIFGKDDNATLAKPAKLDLNQIFTLFKIIDIKETTIDGNQLLSDNKRLLWPYTDKGVDAMSTRASSTSLTINPMEIRTFIIKVKYEGPKQHTNSDNHATRSSCVTLLLLLITFVNLAVN